MTGCTRCHVIQMRRSVSKLYKNNCSLLSLRANNHSRPVSLKQVSLCLSSSSSLVAVDGTSYNTKTPIQHNIYRKFYTYRRQQQQQQIQSNAQQVTQKWTLNSLVSDVVTEEYTKKSKEEFVEEDLQLLKKSRIKTLEDWAALSDEKKKKYPDTLVDILDNVSLPQGMSFVLQYEKFGHQ